MGEREEEVELTMGGGIVKVEMSFFDTLSVIALGITQAKKPLLQKVVLFVPKGKCNVL